MKKKKNTGYKLSQDQVLLLENLREYKEYKKVLPPYKGMVTMSIKRRRIINTKHRNGVKEALKTVDNNLLKRFNSPTLNTQRPIKVKIKPFNEVYVKESLLTKQENHRKYLKSSIWKRKRNFILNKRGCKCEICKMKFKKEELHIHHKTYRKWGAEYQKHLQVLCSKCHNKLHDKYTIYQLEEFFSKGTNIQF